jgi:predicted N-acetyltransferase YhbS
MDLSFTARVGTLLVGSVRLSPVRIGQTKALLLGPMPGPVDPARPLVAELVDGAFDGVSGPIRAE